MATTTGRRRSRGRSGPPMTLARAQRLTGVGLDNADLTVLVEAVRAAEWLRHIGPTADLAPGELTRRAMVIPQSEAQTALRSVVRLVADLPRNTTPTVVWQDRGSELEVDTAATSIRCKVGVVIVGVQVRCDQHPEVATIEVPIGVGTADRPKGLVMSTLSRLDGPEVIVARWSEAITAFGWECLVETSRRLCELAGTDARGRHVLPGAIGSASRELVIQPMAAHTRTGPR